MTFIFLPTEKVAKTAAQLKQRFSRAAPVKGTLGLRNFTPIDAETLLVSKLSGRPGQMVKVSCRKGAGKC